MPAANRFQMRSLSFPYAWVNLLARRMVCVRLPDTDRTRCSRLTITVCFGVAIGGV